MRAFYTDTLTKYIFLIYRVTHFKTKSPWLNRMNYKNSLFDTIQSIFSFYQMAFYLVYIFYNKNWIFFIKNFASNIKGFSILYSVIAACIPDMFSNIQWNLVHAYSMMIMQQEMKNCIRIQIGDKQIEIDRHLSRLTIVLF